MIYEYQCTSTTECHPITIELVRGRYLLECYGASGGTGLTNSEYKYHGGYGAYASGILNLEEKTTFYLYIGGRGEDGVNDHSVKPKGGWNGGGNGGADSATWADDTNPDTPGAGGGSTDIRLIKAKEGKESTDEESLDSRIIVAAGGSGSCFNSYGAPGGDLTGYQVFYYFNESYYRSDTTQISGYGKGRGADGEDHIATPVSGAGGGYYGGKAGIIADSHVFDSVSSSGSSYVAGYQGCPDFPNDIDNSFGSILYKPTIINGYSDFPSLYSSESKTTEKGHSGNGAIKITRIEICTCRTKCKGTRYILFFDLILVIKH